MGRVCARQYAPILHAPVEVTLLIVPPPLQAALPSIATALGRNARPSISLAMELACVLLRTDVTFDMTLRCYLERSQSVNVGDLLK